MIRTLLVDNYDSFTYNLYQYLCELGAEVEVRRNDAVSLAEIGNMAPERIVISPGPGGPQDAGISVDVVRYFGNTTPILGVCLGHQCIGYALGATVGRAGEIMHGKTSRIRHNGRGLFHDLPSPFEAIRYHSLAVLVDRYFPQYLEITAWTENNVVMGLKHKTLPIEGVQFHPESIKTPFGKDILKSFLYPDRSNSSAGSAF